MNIRLISGSLGGRRLCIGARNAGFRPTLERSREAVASMLAGRIPGATVADVCAGSGAFGFEMVSRGAKRTDFVEKHAGRAASITTHAAHLKIDDRCRIFREDVRRFVERSSFQYDIIFYDPPYDDLRLVSCAGLLFDRLAKGGVLVYEHARIDDLPAVPDRTRRYGDSVFDFFNAPGV